jgi:hypothetical protein
MQPHAPKASELRNTDTAIVLRVITVMLQDRVLENIGISENTEVSKMCQGHLSLLSPSKHLPKP